MNRGVSMVEMVVATALLGVGVSACVASIGAASRASRAAQEYTLLQLLAREKLAELRGGTALPGEDRGDFGPDHPGCSWIQRVEEEGPRLRRVRLTLAAGEGEDARRLEVVTLVAAP